MSRPRTNRNHDLEEMMSTLTRTTRRAGGVLAALAVLAAPAAATAATENGGVPGDWLSRYNSARSLGLGGAMVATPDQPLSSLWNPAGLSLLDRNTVNLETAMLYEGTGLYGASFALPSRKLPSLGVTVVALSSGGFDRTNELNESLGEFGESDMAFVLTASQMISPRFSVGANLKVATQSLEESGATGVGFDLGAVYDVTPTLRAGVSALNLGGPSLQHDTVSEAFPTEFRAGLALRILQGRGLVSAELDQRSGTGAAFRLGTEFGLYRNLSVRLGFTGEDPSGGMSYDFDSGFGVHYGLTDQELGMSHRIGISYAFGGFHARATAKPEVFSPLGRNSVTRIDLESNTKAETERWRLEIADNSGRVIRTFGGPGAPPSHVMWDGKDESGFPLPDGQYGYVLTVDDAEGRILAGPARNVIITTEGPQGGIQVSSTEEPR